MMCLADFIGCDGVSWLDSQVHEPGKLGTSVWKHPEKHLFADRWQMLSLNLRVWH